MAIDVLTRRPKESPASSPAADDARPAEAPRFPEAAPLELARPDERAAVAPTARRGRLALAERKLVLFIGDLLLLNAALLLSVTLAPHLAIPLQLKLDLQTIVGNIRWFISLSILWYVVAMAGDAYDLRQAARRFAGSLAVGRTVLVVALLYLLLPYVSAPLTLTRLSWVLFAAFALLGVTTWRYFYATVFVQPQFRQNLLIVGAGATGRSLCAAIAEYAQEYQVIGFIDDDPAKANKVYHHVPVLGCSADLLAHVERHQVHEIALATSTAQHMRGELFQGVMDCQARGIRLTSMVHMYERLTGRVPVEQFGQQVYVLAPLNHTSVTPLYLFTQRLIDIGVALVAGIVFAVLLPFLALLIRLDSPGPIFYRQQRVGKGGKVFWIAKLRTMVADAESDGQAVWARDGDSRITRFGRLARKTRLDELPQMWNVLRGEMSLVGPRPERPEIEVELQQQLPFYRSRHMIKPGITGWAQINYGYGASVEDALMKLQYDLYYVKHRSLWLDLLILLRTVGVVLRAKGT
jgi:exopolysaccharide biosynthesis polyprenyl glycosylphosphotransferase